MSASRPQIHDVVRRADHRLLVLHHDECVALVPEGSHDFQQPSDIARVKSHAGLVHHKESVDQRGTEAGGEVHTLDLAAAERFCGTIEGKVTETDRDEVAEP